MPTVILLRNCSMLTGMFTPGLHFVYVILNVLYVRFRSMDIVPSFNFWFGHHSLDTVSASKAFHCSFRLILIDLSVDLLSSLQIRRRPVRFLPLTPVYLYASMPPSRIWHAFFLSCRDVLYWLPFFQRFSNRSAATVDPSHLHVGIIYVTCNSPAELFHACRHVYTLHLFRVCVTSWGKRVVRLSNTSSSLLPSSYRLDLLDFLTHSFYKHRPAFQSTLLHVTKFSKIVIFELISPLRYSGEGWRETSSASYPPSWLRLPLYSLHRL